MYKQLANRQLVLGEYIPPAPTDEGSSGDSIPEDDALVDSDEGHL